MIKVRVGRFIYNFARSLGIDLLSGRRWRRLLLKENQDAGMCSSRRSDRLRTVAVSCLCSLVLVSSILWAQEPDLLLPDTPEEPLVLVEAPVARTAAVPQRSDVRLQKPKSISQYDIPGLKKRKSLRNRLDMDVVTFIQWLSDPTTGGNLNVAISPRVKGATVKVMLTDVTIGDALEIVLAANSLAYEVIGSGERSIINIMTDEEYRAKHGVGFHETREMKILELKHTSPARVVDILKGMKSTIGTLIHDEPTSTVILIDTPGKIREMSAVAARADQPTETLVFKLQHAAVADVAEKVAKILTTGVGTLASDERTKTVIVTDLPATMVKVKGMLAAFDVRKKEVSLQAKIVEVELSDDFNLGINWTHVLQNLAPRYSLESIMPLSTSAGASLSYKTIAAGGDMSVVLEALKTIGDTKVISNPQISVEDGPEAELKVVRDQPYRVLQYESGSTNVIAVNYQFVEIGVVLKVTAKINDERFIGVDIKATMSDLVDWYDYSPGNEGLVGIPVVKKSEASTTVSVKDGVTIIIGGMIKEEKRKTEAGVPILRSIPLVGRLFRSTVERKRKIETIVFLTPRIISGEEQFLQMSTTKKKLKLRERSPTSEAPAPSAKIMKVRSIRGDGADD